MDALLKAIRNGKESSYDLRKAELRNERQKDIEAAIGSPKSVSNDIDWNSMRLSQDDENMYKCVSDDKYKKIYNAKLTSSNKDETKSSRDLCNETIKEVKGNYLGKILPKLWISSDRYKNIQDEKKLQEKIKTIENQVKEFITYSQLQNADVEKFVTDISIRIQVICRCIIRANQENEENNQQIIKNITDFMNKEYPDFTEDLETKCLRRLPEPINVPLNDKAGNQELIKLEKLNIKKYHDQLNSTTIDDNERLIILSLLNEAKQRIKYLEKPQKRTSYISPFRNRGGKRTKKSYKKSKKANTRKHKKSKKVTFKKNKKTRKH